MKILYVYQQPRSETSGLSVYDRRLSRALEDMGHAVHRVPLDEAPPRLGYLGLARGLPPAIARYQTSQNARAVATAMAQINPDRVVLSHESTLFLVEQGIVPREAATLLCHNIMAAGYRSRGSIADYVYGGLFHLYEKRLARSGVPITAISAYDQAQARRDYTLEMAALCPPGVLPDTTAIASDADFTHRVTISGNYDWRLKRQDITAFFAEAQQCSLTNSLELFLSPGAAKHAPEGLHHTLGMTEGRAMSIGLVVDRFQAGFKLKALEYVSTGMAIASYADLSVEFAGAPDADVFVRKISNASDILAFATKLGQIEDRNARFRAFQQWVIDRYQWQRSAEALERVLNRT